MDRFEDRLELENGTVVGVSLWGNCLRVEEWINGKLGASIRAVIADEQPVRAFEIDAAVGCFAVLAGLHDRERVRLRDKAHELAAELAEYNRELARVRENG